MNKYYVRVGYSCTSFGNLSGVVYANSQTEAEELVSEDIDNIHEQDYETGDSQDYNYYDSEAVIDLDEENVSPPVNQNTNTTATSNLPFSNTPAYFLAELSKL